MLDKAVFTHSQVNLYLMYPLIMPTSNLDSSLAILAALRTSSD